VWVDCNGKILRVIVLQDTEVMKSEICSVSVESCLLEQVFFEICKIDRDLLYNVVIVLPTKRLSTLLLAMLAKKHGAFRPPRMFTLETFVQDFSCSNNNLSLISDLALEFIVKRLIKEKSYRHLNVDHTHELGIIFSEIIEKSVGKSIFEKIQDIFMQESYRSKEVVTFFLSRLLEIKSLYFDLLFELNKKELLLFDQYMSQCSRNFCEKDILSFSWRFIYIGGFTTLKDYYKPVIKKLIKDNRTNIFMSSPVDGLDTLSPLSVLYDSLFSDKKEIKVIEQINKKSEIFVRSCENIVHEIKVAIRLIKSYQELGVDLSDIGLVVSQEDLYDSLLKSEIKNCGLECNYALARVVKKSALGKFLQSLTKVVLYKYSSLEMLDFLMQPIVKIWAQKFFIDNQEYDFVVSYELAKVSSLSGGDNYSSIFSSDSFCKMLTELSANLQKYFTVKGKIAIKDWMSLISGFVFEVLLQNNEHSFISYKKDYEIVMKCLQELCRVDKTKYSPSDFFNILYDKVLSTEIRDVGYPLKGVQVVKITEARYVPFRVVIVLGCVEGLFPRSMPSDTLIDDWLKVKIGLRSWKYIESLEDTTFHLLLKRISNLHLLYPRWISEDKIIPSRFVEKLKREGKFSRFVYEKIGFLDKDNIIDNQKCKIVKGKFSGERKTVLNDVSSASLKLMLTCPYRYLLYKLNVKGSSLYEDSLLKDQGQLLHQILESFYSSVYKGKVIIGPLEKNIPSDKVEETIFFRLCSVTDIIAKNKLDLSVLLHLKKFSWIKLSKFLSGFYVPNDKGMSETIFTRSYRELNFSKVNKQMQLSLNSFNSDEKISLNVTGQIDSLDYDNDYSVIIDYKRKSVKNSSCGDFPFDPQLVFYALCLAQEDNDFNFHLNKSLLGYWSILEGRFVPAFVGDELKSHEVISQKYGTRIKKLEEFVSLLQKSWEKKYWHLSDEKNDFTPVVSEHCKFCDYQDICRYNKDKI
jgi:ATP-dependent helicase/DNAse subunit B